MVTASFLKLPSIQTCADSWQCHVLRATFRYRGRYIGSQRSAASCLVSSGTSTISSLHQSSSYLHRIIMSRNPLILGPLSTFAVWQKLSTWIRPGSVSTQEKHRLRLHFISNNTGSSYWKPFACTKPGLHACLCEERERDITHPWE